MGYWLRFAVVTKTSLQNATPVTPLRWLSLGSGCKTFVSAIYQRYKELTPVSGKLIPATFRLEDGEPSYIIHTDQHGALRYYTKEEILEALKRAEEFGYEEIANPDDTELFKAVRSLPCDQVLVRVLWY